MDYDENLRESISNIRMLMKMGRPPVKLRVHFAKAQKHVGFILDLGISCGAITLDSDNREPIERAEKISRGEWSTVEDFEETQKFFRDCYRKTRFYDVTIQQDNRPAVVRKYGRGYT